MKINKIIILLSLSITLNACSSTGLETFLNATGNGLGAALGAIERAGEKTTPKSQTRCYELYGEIRCETY